MKALVDTSVLAAPSRPGVAPSWSVSVITVGELEAGVMLALDDAERAFRLDRLTSVLAEAPVLSIDHRVATSYGKLRAAAGRQPSSDLWIAATALAHDLTLITGDRRLADLPLVRTHLVATRT